MARDLNRMHVSYFSRTLGLSVYPACGIHGLLPEDKEIPDTSIEECMQEFIKRTENLMRHVGRKASADPEIKKTRSILSEYLKGAPHVDWSDMKAMEAFCGKTRAVEALLERRLKDRNFRYASDFSEEIVAPVCFAYAAHLRTEDIRANPPQYVDFEYRSEPKTEAERKRRENIKKQCHLADKMALERKISLMERITDSSRQELDRNLKALDKKYDSGNGSIEESLKEHTDSCRKAILSHDWFDPGQMKTVYDKSLSEVKWLNQRMQSLK